MEKAAERGNVYLPSHHPCKKTKNPTSHHPPLSLSLSLSLISQLLPRGAKLLQPRLHKRHLIGLHLPHGPRRQDGRGLIRKAAILIPMMHGALDQQERAFHTARAIGCETHTVRTGAAPGILLAVDDGETVVADVVAAVAVDGGGVGRGGDVEGVAAHERIVVQGQEAGDEGEAGGGHAGAGLQVAPLGAVLVGPAAPEGLGEVVLRVEGLVVVAVGLVQGAAAGAGVGGGEDRQDVVLLDVGYEVEHWGGEGGGFVGVAAGGEEGLDEGGGVRGGGGVGDEGWGGEVAAVFVEGWVVEVGIPVAALPAADGVAEDLGEVIVVASSESSSSANFFRRSVCVEQMENGFLRDGLHVKSPFQQRGILGVVQQDIIHHIDEFGLLVNAIGRSIFPHRLIVPPEIPNGLGHARRRDCPVINVGIQHPQERHECPCIRATVAKICRIRCCQALVL